MRRLVAAMLCLMMLAEPAMACKKHIARPVVHRCAPAVHRDVPSLDGHPALAAAPREHRAGFWSKYGAFVIGAGVLAAGIFIGHRDESGVSTVIVTNVAGSCFHRGKTHSAKPPRRCRGK